MHHRSSSDALLSTSLPPTSPSRRTHYSSKIHLVFPRAASWQARWALGGCGSTKVALFHKEPPRPRAGMRAEGSPGVLGALHKVREQVCGAVEEATRQHRARHQSARALDAGKPACSSPASRVRGACARPWCLGNCRAPFAIGCSAWRWLKRWNTAALLRSRFELGLRHLLTQRAMDATRSAGEQATGVASDGSSARRSGVLRAADRTTRPITWRSTAAAGGWWWDGDEAWVFSDLSAQLIFVSLLQLESCVGFHARLGTLRVLRELFD